jgi:hypothetical protein
MYRTFFYGLKTYRVYNRHQGARSDLEDKNNYADKFFEKGTIQYKWRNLYNDLCDRIYQHVKMEELWKEDRRFVKWAEKDDEGKTKRKISELKFEKEFIEKNSSVFKFNRYAFKLMPSTLPT